MSKNYTYHIITDSGYRAIPAAEYERLCIADPDFAGKHFEKYDNELIEVSAEEHEAEEKRANHERHLKRRDRKYGLMAYESWDTDTLLGVDMIADRDVFAEDDAVLEIMADKLHAAMDELTDAERDLVEAIYFCELTERELAEKLGISQPAVNKRKHRILSKLKKMMDS